VGDLSLNGTPRTRIVNHNWKTIRNAMHVAKNEHMSSVDGYVSPSFYSLYEVGADINSKDTRSDIHKIRRRRNERQSRSMLNPSALKVYRMVVRKRLSWLMKNVKTSSSSLQMISQLSVHSWTEGCRISERASSYVQREREGKYCTLCTCICLDLLPL
jgi:DNA topoisomerase IA